MIGLTKRWVVNGREGTKPPIPKKLVGTIGGIIKRIVMQYYLWSDFFNVFYFSCFVPQRNSVRLSHIAKIKDILCDYFTNFYSTVIYTAQVTPNVLRLCKVWP